MAEEKDYVGILWQDQLSWLGDTPQETIQNVKRRLIELGAEPGTTEYETAFVNILNRGMITEGKPFRAGGLAFTPSPAGRLALDYLKKNMTVKEIEEELGIDPIVWDLGKDRKGASRSSKTGEIILANDPYQRNQFNERMYTADGLAAYKGITPGTVPTGKWDSLRVNLSDLKTVPKDIFSIFTDFPIQREMSDGSIATEERPIPQELIDMGLTPGAEVTPELIKKYEAWSLTQLSPQLYSQYTGQPFAPGYDLQGNYVGEDAVDSFGNLIEGTGSGTGDGTTTKNITGNVNNMTSTEYNSRMGVYASMAERFNRYGLTALANKIKDLAIKGASEATITLELQDTPEYQERFAANAARIKKGLTALTPSVYVNTEDAYRQVLRAYGLKQFDNDAYIQQFISNDMSPTEFSNRVVTAVQRVQNSDPAILKQLTQYYGVGKNDLVAYVLDPEQQFQEIERRVAAAEIGVAAGRQGLEAGQDVARQLAAQGVTKQEAEQGYATIASRLPAAEKLSDIYGGTMDAYRQSEAEQDVFNSLASAQRKREALRQREIAAFSGSSGVNKTSLTSETRGQF